MKQKIPIIFSKALYDLALPTSQSHFPPLLFPRQPPALFTELKSHCPSPHIPPEVLGMLGGAGSVFTYCSLSLEAIFPKFLQASLFSHFLEIFAQKPLELPYLIEPPPLQPPLFFLYSMYLSLIFCLCSCAYFLSLTRMSTCLCCSPLFLQCPYKKQAHSRCSLHPGANVLKVIFVYAHRTQPHTHGQRSLQS